MPSQMARMPSTISRMRSPGGYHGIEKRCSTCGFIWEPRPSTNRPPVRVWRSPPALARVIGVRAKAMAIAVPSWRSWVCSAATAKRKERVVLGLEAERPVVADGLQRRIDGPGERNIESVGTVIDTCTPRVDPHGGVRSSRAPVGLDRERHPTNRTGSGPHHRRCLPPAGRPLGSRATKLAVARRITLLVFLLVPAAGAVVLAALGQTAWAIAVGAGTIVLLTWLWWLIGRRVRSFGYAERADDLLVTSGILFRRLVVVPYGRMQLVDLTAGPLDRALGVATVQLHTAAATTDATIPGLPPEDAGALRDRLATRARNGQRDCDRPEARPPDPGRTHNDHRPGNRPRRPLLRRRQRIAQLIGVAAALVALYTVVLGIMFLEWSRYSFGFDDTGDFRVDRGVIQHSHQKVQLSRLQSVEVAQPFIPRLFGLAEVIVEVAGAGDSRVKVSYLDKESAQALRNEIVAHAAGVDAMAPSAPENLLTAVDNNQLLLSLLLRFRTLALFVLTALLLVLAFLTGGWGALGIALVTGGVPAFGVANKFLVRYGFTVAESPDGLRIRHGLTSTVASTVPRAACTQSDSAPVRSGDCSDGSAWLWTSAATRGRATTTDATPPHSSRSPTGTPPSRWWRGCCPGRPADLDFAPIPERARWRAPLQWRRIGVNVTDRVFIARRGRIEQWLTVVPHGRVQSVRITQGPWERSLRLASLHLDTVPGPVHVVVPHMDVNQIRDLAEHEQDRASAARRGAGPQRWMTASGAPSGGQLSESR